MQCRHRGHLSPADPPDTASQAQRDAVHQPQVPRSEGKNNSGGKYFKLFSAGAEKVLYLRWGRRCWRNLSQLLQSPFLEIINL